MGYIVKPLIFLTNLIESVFLVSGCVLNGQLSFYSMNQQRVIKVLKSDGWQKLPVRRNLFGNGEKMPFSLTSMEN